MKRCFIPLIFLILFCASGLFADSAEKKCNEMIRSEEIFFHGRRMKSNHESFRVVLVAMHTRVLTVRFNMPVDPRTVNGKTSLINGKKLPQGTFMRFSKTGGLVEIKFPEPMNEPFALDVSQVTAFDGSQLSLGTFTGIGDGTKLKFPAKEDEEEEHED